MLLRGYRTKLALMPLVLLCGLLFSGLQLPCYADGVGFAAYYVLGDEADIIDALKMIPNAGVPAGHTAANLNSRLSLVSSADGNHVYLDEWENGYQFDPNDPYNTADAKWDTPTGGVNDFPALAEGEVLTLWETNTFVPGSQGVDGGDMIFISGAPVCVVRTVWPDTPGPYLAGSWELYPIQAWQDAYTVPIGEDLTFTESYYPFEYTFLFFESVVSNTRVVVTDPASGVILDATYSGVTNIFMTNINAGTTIVASDAGSGEARKIQAGVITSQNGVYDSRYYILTPERYLGQNYYLHAPTQQFPPDEPPYSDSIRTNAAYVYAFYDNTAVTISTNGGSYSTTLTNAGDVYRFAMPLMPYGTYEGFYGVSVTADKKIWVLVAGDDSEDDLDWGYQALDSAYLSDDYYTPFAPANPGHVTPVYDDTLIFVDWNNDGTNELIAILDRHETLELYDSDEDGTGAHIFGNKPFALAWGQDNTEQSPGEPLPDFDYGFTILPLYWYEPQLLIEKSPNPTNLPVGGGTSTFTLVVSANTNTIYNVDIGDNLPPGWDYVTNTTTITYSDGTPSSNPDPTVTNQDLHWNLDHDLGPTQTITVVFDAWSVTGQFNVGWQVNKGEAWGYSLNDSSSSNAFPFNPDDYAFVYIPQNPILSIDKTTGGVDPLDPGDTYTYTITITNIGDVAQTGIRVRDYTPTGVSYVASSTWVIRDFTPATNTVRDEFSSGGYADNDGTVDWTGDWDELSDDDDPSNGTILVTSGELRFQQAGGNDGIERAVDLSAYTNATFTYDWRVSGLEEDISVYVSTNGSDPFVLLATYSGQTGNGSGNHDITGYMSADTTVRFANPSGTAWNFANDQAFFDDVQIEFSRGGSITNAGGSPPILADGYSLGTGETMRIIFDVTVDNPATETQIVNTAYVRSNLQDDLQDSVTNIVAIASIGDLVWNDANTNGVQDAGETGLVGVAVNLYDGDTNLLQTTTTDSSGNYLFTGLPPSNYVVGFVTPTNYYLSPRDQGGSDTNDSDPDATSGYTEVISLSRGTNALYWDAGMYVPPSSIGDFVWFDANTNGIQDGTASETGFPGVAVSLYDGNTNLVGSTTTDSSGYYVFTNLSPGAYFLDFDLPVDYTFSPADQGGSDTNDSDAAVATGRTPIFTLTSGANDSTWDAGLVLAEPGLRITKTSDFGGACWSPGDTITYTITVENTGTVVHSITTVTDPTPSGTTYVTNSTEIIAPTTVITTNTVRDEFNAIAYTNNNGTTDWANDWQEVNEVNGPNVNAVRVQNRWGSNYQLRIYNTARGAWRQVDLSGATSATLSYYYRINGFDGAGESSYLNISSNGGVNWVELDSWTANVGTTTFTNYDISAYIAGNTAIIFSNSTVNGGGEGPQLDDIQIEWTTSSRVVTTNAGGAPPTLATGYTLLTGETMTVTFEVTVNSPVTDTQIVNTATVTSERHPPLGASVTDCVVHADLAVDKIVTDSAPYESQAIQYHIAVTNKGPDNTTNVELTDLLPNEVQYHSHSNGTYNEITGIWDIGDMDVGWTTTLYINVTVDGGISGTVTNWAEVTASDLYDPVETNNKDSAEFTPQTTFALVSMFRVREVGGQVMVEWETSAEAGTVGFFIHRYDPEAGEYVGVNDRLMPSVLAPQGGAYQLADPGAKAGGRYLYKLQEVEARGESRWYGPFEVSVARENVQYARGVKTRGSRSAARIERAGSARFSRTAKTISEPMRARLASRDRQNRVTGRGRQLLRGSRVKILVTEQGLYYVDADEVASVLDVRESLVRWMLAYGYLELSNQGDEVVYIAAEHGSGLYFYGEALDSNYTDVNVYWLRFGRAESADTVYGGAPVPVPESVFRQRLHEEEETMAVPALVSDPEDDFWMWGYVIAGMSGWDSHTIPVSLAGVCQTGTTHVAVELLGGSDTGVDNEHHAVLKVNGQPIGEGRWTGLERYRLEGTIDQSLLPEGLNIIEVEALLEPGVPYSIFYVDSADVGYDRVCRAVDERLDVAAASNTVITVTGFTNALAHVVDVTDPRSPKVVSRTTRAGVPDNYSVSWAPKCGDRRYVALTLDGVRRPDHIVAAKAAELAQPRQRAEYVIITVDHLVEAATELAAYRAGQGYDTMVVDLETIYDTFSYGIEDPSAIREFLRHAYRQWKIPPYFAVLVGDGTFDYKDNMGMGDNLVPPKMVATPAGLFASDGWYGDVEGDDGVPEVVIGRLPVLSAEELRDLTDKIVGYESGGGDWARVVMLTADDADGAGDFPSDSDKIGLLVPGEFVKDRIYLSEQTTSDARDALLNGIERGALLLNYIGHAGMDRFAQEGLLTTADVPGMTNGERLPVALAMTCLAGRFSVPGFDCLAETLVMQPNGGACGVWGPTGLSMNDLAVRLNEGFMLSRFTDDERVLGDLIRSAIEDYAVEDLPPYISYIYNLLGDPALEVK